MSMAEYISTNRMDGTADWNECEFGTQVKGLAMEKPKISKVR